MGLKIRMCFLFIILLLLQIFFQSTSLFAAQTDKQVKLVSVIPIKGTINPGLSEFLSDAIRQAKNNGSDAIILEIDTLGGRVDAAMEMRDLILEQKIPTIAYIHNRALSAGALITISAKHIVVSPSATIGAAVPYRFGPGLPIEVQKKDISALRGEFEATAERTGRKSNIAAGMVDENVKIDGIKEKGEVLTLTSKEALKVGYADKIVPNYADIKKLYGWQNAKIERINFGAAQEFMQFVTRPWFVYFLLFVLVAGILIEIKTLGTGVGATMGFLALMTLFAGNFMAGIIGWKTILLFVIGLILFFIEAHVPGFGIFGIAGAVAVFLSIFQAMGGGENAAIALLVSLVVIIFFSFMILRYLPKSKFWKKISLEYKQENIEGYVASKFTGLSLGQIGETLTQLRPAGAAEFDGKRYDVVSDAQFIAPMEKVTIINIEGNRIVVKKLENISEK